MGSNDTGLNAQGAPRCSFTELQTSNPPFGGREGAAHGQMLYEPFKSLFTLPYSHSCTCKTVGHTHSVLPRHRNPLYTKPFFKRALLNVLYHGPFQSGHKCQWSPGSRQAWRSDPAALGWPGWEEWGGTCPGEGPEVQVVHGEQSCEELSWDGSVKGMLWEGSKHEDSWWRFRKRQKEKKKWFMCQSEFSKCILESQSTVLFTGLSNKKLHSLWNKHAAAHFFVIMQKVHLQHSPIFDALLLSKK